MDGRGWFGSSNKPGLSPRRLVLVSRVKPNVDIVAVVYSCFCTLCLFMLLISCLFNIFVVTCIFNTFSFPQRNISTFLQCYIPTFCHP